MLSFPLYSSWAFKLILQFEEQLQEDFTSFISFISHNILRAQQDRNRQLHFTDAGIKAGDARSHTARSCQRKG